MQQALMHQAVERRIRRRVADALGVGIDELTPEVSLTDDLAADSLDLLEMALELEEELGISVPERLLDRVRTYGELVTATLDLARRGPTIPAVAAAPRPVLVRAGVRLASGGGRVLERSGWLTPYTVETIAEDALRAGPGARLDVSVSPDTNLDELKEVQARFAWLHDRGLTVRVRRDDGTHRRRSGLRHREEHAA